MGKYIVLEGAKFTLYPSLDSLRTYVATKPQSWVFRSSSDYPKRNATVNSKAIKAGQSVIISLSGGIVTPRYQAAQVGKWVI